MTAHSDRPIGRHAAEPATATPPRDGGLPTPAGALPTWKERRIRELMQAELAHPLSLCRLANECGLSVRQFTRAFRLSTGLSPHRYLLELRLQRARELLLDPSRRLNEIAMAYGFADQSHFTRAFGYVENMSPGIWRRLHIRITLRTQYR